MKKENVLSVDETIRKMKELEESALLPPILRRYKSNDATIEKLGEMLCDNPAGFLMLRDELTGLLASWERSGHEGDRAFYLESWNGNVSFDTDRIGRGSIFIPNLCLSIFGGIQPDKLQALLELTANALANDGTIQRFQMLVYPDYQKWEYRDRIPNKDARDAIYDLFEKISEFDPVSFGAHPADEFNKFPYFKFSAEAQDVYVSWSTQLHTVKIPAEDNPLIAQHLTKYDKLFPAIALILHIVDCVGNGTRGPVSREAAVRAAAWCEYLESHARRCYGLLADRGLCAAQNLSQKILQGELEDGFTARDVQRRQWSRLDDKDVVQEALEWLVDHNWLRKRIGISRKQGGRPTDTYHINPKVLIKATVKVDGDISATG